MNVIRFLLQNHTQVLELTLEHLWLVGLSTAFAMLIGIPLGIIIAHRPSWNKPVLASANIIQTIPSLALFGFLLPVPWLGARSDRLAILALDALRVVADYSEHLRGNSRSRRSRDRSGQRDGTHRIAAFVSGRVAACRQRNSLRRQDRRGDFRRTRHDCCRDRRRWTGRVHLPRIGHGRRPSHSRRCHSGGDSGLARGLRRGMAGAAAASSMR